MISRRENRVGGVLAFEHSGRMRHPNQEHCVLARVGSGIVQRVTGILLEHIVNVLDAGDVAFANAIHSFVKPADRRPERDAVVTNFSRRL